MKIHTQAELTANIECGEILEIVAAGVFAVTVYGTAAPYITTQDGVDLTVEARESSQPRVEAWGSSQPRVEAWESSQPRVVAWESSQPRVVARESSQPRVVAWESSQPRVEAWESSQPRVVARESSQPRVEARGSSQPRVEARESSQPRVEAWGYTQLSIFGGVAASCAATVSIVIDGACAKVEGGQQTFVQKSTPAEWCAYYGVQVSGEIATLYKAVSADGKSPRGADYSPGLIPIATDWNGATQECGGGLHFSPTPAMARAFFPHAERFIACPVALKDIVVHPNGDYPEKVKARGCAAPTWEVDEDGEKIASGESA